MPHTEWAHVALPNDLLPVGCVVTEEHLTFRGEVAPFPPSNSTFPSASCLWVKLFASCLWVKLLKVLSHENL
jgi:hypothetical protein